MDLMFLIILWLKAFLEKLKSIASFVEQDYLPDDKEEPEDNGFEYFG